MEGSSEAKEAKGRRELKIRRALSTARAFFIAGVSQAFSRSLALSSESVRRADQINPEPDESPKRVDNPLSNPLAKPPSLAESVRTELQIIT